jgi:hypothetical protein
MTARTRTLLLLVVMTALLAACGTATGAPLSPSQEPSHTPVPTVEPSEAPAEEPAESPASEEREVEGTITAAEMAFSGPGGTIAEAIAAGDSGEFPTLVNGVLFRDTDGRVYIATSISDDAAPTFDGPMLEVLNFPNDGPSWDMANAELIGLEEANGIVFMRNAQMLGFVDVK